MLKTVADRMEAMGIHLDASDEAVAELAKEGFDPKYGARPLRRAIQSQVEDAVAEKMLDGTPERGRHRQAHRRGRQAHRGGGGAAGSQDRRAPARRSQVKSVEPPQAKAWGGFCSPGRGEGLGGWHPGL